MRLSIGETAELTGVSIRTLRYYDKIGLLKPAEVSESGYRYYSRTELERLQQILFYRELEFSLNEIKRLLSSPDEYRTQAMERHLELLLLKRERLDGLIRLAEETIGGKIMTEQIITAADIDAVKTKFAEEVRDRWGNTAEFEQSERRFSEMSEDGKEKLAEEQDRIFAAFAECAELSPDDERVQALVGKWHGFICENYFDCSAQVLAELGKMYIGDGRFTENLDRYGKGTALIMSRGIEKYVEMIGVN